MAMTAEAAADRFLKAFHAERPAATSRAFGHLPMRLGEQTVASSYDAIVEALDDDKAPERVLDVACGDGFLIERLALRRPSGTSLCGVDFSAAELASAHHRLGKSALLVRARAEALPFASGQFDAVVSHMALMLFSDVQGALSEMRRVVHKGSRWAAIVGGEGRRLPVFDAYHHALSSAQRSTVWQGVNRIGDPRTRKIDGLRDLLAQAGFELTQTDELEATRRLTPTDAWDAFVEMYDIHLRTSEGRALIEERFLADATALCDEDGRLEHGWMLRRVLAKAI